AEQLRQGGRPCLAQFGDCNFLSSEGEIARVVGGSHDNSWNVQLSRTCQDTVEVVGGSGDERAGRRLTKERSQCVLVNCIQFQVNTNVVLLSHLKCCDSQAAQTDREQPPQRCCPRRIPRA